MDIYCPRCGEPWEIDSLHDEAQAQYAAAGYAPYYIDEEARRKYQKNPRYNSKAYEDAFKAVSEQFRSEGCGGALSTAFTSGEQCVKTGSDRAAIAAAAYDILGDDLDGAASMFDDYGI